MSARILLVLTTLFIFNSQLHAETHLSRFAFAERHMGIQVELILYAPNQPTAIQASRSVFERIAELDQRFSDYKPDSELMKLCRTSQAGHPVAVSDDLFNVLAESKALFQESDGAFDVTVGNLVQLWRRARRQKKLPEPDRLKAALKRTGSNLMVLHPDTKSVELLQTQMRLDLGGIAKGTAGDEALKILKRHQISSALINLGGDVVLGDAPPNQAGWKISVGSLRDPDTKAARSLILKNCAIATSGDAFQFVEIGGVRYSHIVNPKTGLGLTTRSSVTIIAPTGSVADSLASAVSVLGPTKGLELIKKRKQTECYLITPDSKIVSPGFPKPKNR